MLRTRSLALLLASLAFLVLTSCHGHGTHSISVRPPIFSLQVGVPLRDAVVFGGVNSYAASVRAGSVYKISITAPTDDVDLLYFGTDASFTQLASCAINNTALIGFTAEDCVVTAPGNVLYFSADGRYLFNQSAAFTVAVEELSVTDLAATTPAASGEDVKTAGLFAVPVSAGSRYTAAATGMNGDASLYVFAGGNLSSPSTCTIDNTLFTGTTPEDCTVVAGSGTLYFIVDPVFSSAPTTDFTVFAAPSPSVPAPANEGTSATPVALPTDVPTVGQAGFNGTSFYSAPVTTAGSKYTISITGLTNDANLTVYDNDSTFTTPATCSPDNTFFTGTTAEDCTITATGNTVFFKVTANTLSGGVAYITLVSPGP